MSTQVVLTLPDEVYRLAEQLAQNTGQEVADLLAEKLRISIVAASDSDKLSRPVSALNDGDVLALSYLQMEEEQDQRLSDLLYRQQSGEITEAEHLELQHLMQVYREGLLRKSQALAEAVRRGLRELPSP